MKNVLKMMLFVPVIALASCAGVNLGEEVNEEAVTAYKAEMAKKEEVKSYTFKLDMSGKSDGQSVVSKFEMRKAENGDAYYKVYVKEGSAVSNVEMYQVANEQYEEVSYIISTSQGKKTEMALAKKDNESYEETLEIYSIMTLLPNTLYQEFSTIEGVTDYAEDELEGASFETKFYSKGEGNLSVKATIKDAKPEEGEDEYAKDGEFIATFENYRFSSITIKSVTNKGNKGSGKASASYEKVSVSLPKGWEKNLTTLSL